MIKKELVLMPYQEKHLRKKETGKLLTNHRLKYYILQKKLLFSDYYL